MRVLLVANPDPTHVGRHLINAANEAGIDATLLDVNRAFQAPRLIRSVCWHLLGHRPPRLQSFNQELLSACSRLSPDLVISTGLAPISRSTLETLRLRNITSANFLTDDPWNPSHRAPWFMRALSAYDYVFSPRRANIPDLTSLKGPSVHYLPFAFSPDVHHPVSSPSPQSGKVVFIGGADQDRVQLMSLIQKAGLPLDLWGGYWNRHPSLAPLANGHATAEDFPSIVTNAAVNLCLVRRANRDGHSMRTFELAAMGGCMAVEDTPEHRDLFGPDDHLVRYFSSDSSLIPVLQHLLQNPSDRQRLATAVRAQFFDQSGHRYSDRLQSMIEIAKPSAVCHNHSLT